MKKIITLLFCTAMLSSAFAQNNDDWKYHNDQRNGGNYDNNRQGNRNNNNHTVYQNERNSIAQRDQLVQRVTSEYNYKIQQVSYDRYMNRREKKRAIKELQAQKTERINRIYSEYTNRYVYSDRKNHYDRK